MAIGGRSQHTSRPVHLGGGWRERPSDDGDLLGVDAQLRTVEATREIQIDRYSAISPEGVSVSFLDPANPHEGWQISLADRKSWVRFNDVDFGK